ncbi:hypothetical protein [Dyadobacter jiangsuensis]
MKNMKEKSTDEKASHKSMGRYNPELDKFVGIDLFPEKTAKARTILEKYPVPEHLLKRSSK